jgi:hypothetical protein
MTTSHIDPQLPEGPTDEHTAPRRIAEKTPMPMWQKIVGGVAGLIAAVLLLSVLMQFLGSNDKKTDARTSSGAVQYVTVDQLQNLEDRVNKSFEAQDARIKVQGEAIQNFAAAASAFDAAASKCAITCGGKPAATTTSRRHTGGTTPRINRPVIQPPVVPPPVVATPAPAASTPCTTCKLVAKEEAVTPAENAMCSITVIEHDTRKVIGFIHVTKHETSGRIMVTRVKELKFTPHGDNSANVIGTPKWTPFTSPGTCSGDRAQIYAAWGDAIKMLGFPEKCTWFMSSKT